MAWQGKARHGKAGVAWRGRARHGRQCLNRGSMAEGTRMLTLFIERLAARTVNRIRETGAPRAIIRTHAGYRTVNVEDWEQLLADRRIRMDDVVGIYDTSATTAQIADDLEAMV